MFKIYGSVFALLLLVSMPASAGNYWGVSFGQADVDSAGFDTSDAFKIFGGTRFGTFGVEGAYIDMGDFDVIGSTASVSVDGIEISAMAYHDVGAVTLFAKAGLFLWSATANVSGLALATDDGSDLTYGFGALYKFASLPFSLRGEYQFFQDVSGGDIDMWTIGAQFNF